MPCGNEFGANSLWLPGGKLPEGNLEAIIRTEGMVKDINYVIQGYKLEYYGRNQRIIRKKMGLYFI